MKLLALIPARAGSKRIPKKNIRLLGGEPLIVWSIAVCRDISEIAHVLVSTDSEEIAEVALEAGALVPWLRPEELSHDNASSMDVCLHALDWYEQEFGPIDGLILLQPTSPFRSRQTLLRGIEQFRNNQGKPVVAFSPAESHPLWCYRMEGEHVHPYLPSDGPTQRSQDLPPAFVINGAFYLARPGDLRERRTFLGENMSALIMESYAEGLDMDTEWDWFLAETLLAQQAHGAN